MRRLDTEMSHATEYLSHRCRRTRELTVERRGRPAAHALHLQVRVETATPEREEKLALVAALQRLEHIRRKINALKDLQERSAADRLDPLC